MSRIENMPKKNKQKTVLKSVRIIPLPILFPFLAIPLIFSNIAITGLGILAAISVGWILLKNKELKSCSLHEYKARILKGWSDIRTKSATDPRIRNILICAAVAEGLLFLIAPPLGIATLLISVHVILAHPSHELARNDPIHSEEK